MYRYIKLNFKRETEFVHYELEQQSQSHTIRDHHLFSNRYLLPFSMEEMCMTAMRGAKWTKKSIRLYQ